MQMLCLSVTYHTTPLEFRETLSLPVEALAEALRRCPLRSGRFETIAEMAILSTCNRLEVYALLAPTPPGRGPASSEDPYNSSQERAQILLAYLEEAFGIPAGKVEPFARLYPGIQAAEHLFQVAAGLDSIALGETQILGQVSRALDIALSLGSARHVLSSLFRAAIHAGKRAHSETGIGRRPTSIAALAVRLAEARLGSLAGLDVLVAGAGKMGRHALRALSERASRRITLTNRTYQHALDLARGAAVPVDVLPLESLLEGLAHADLAFFSTAAPGTVVHADELAAIMAARPARPLTLIDLAVPRDIDSRASQIPGVTCLDMDDLQDFSFSAISGDQADLASARAIVAEEVAGYEKLLRIIPFIGELHKKVERIRQQEVEKTLRHLAQPDAQVSEQIELLSRSLVRKILHEPTMHLRAESNEETLNDYVDTLARLYNLSENGIEIPYPEGKP